MPCAVFKRLQSGHFNLCPFAVRQFCCLKSESEDLNKIGYNEGKERCELLIKSPFNNLFMLDAEKSSTFSPNAVFCTDKNYKER